MYVLTWQIVGNFPRDVRRYTRNIGWRGSPIELRQELLLVQTVRGLMLLVGCTIAIRVTFLFIYRFPIPMYSIYTAATVTIPLQQWTRTWRGMCSKQVLAVFFILLLTVSRPESVDGALPVIVTGLVVGASKLWLAYANMYWAVSFLTLLADDPKVSDVTYWLVSNPPPIAIDWAVGRIASAATSYIFPEKLTKAKRFADKLTCAEEDTSCNRALKFLRIL